MVTVLVFNSGPTHGGDRESAGVLSFVSTVFFSFFKFFYDQSAATFVAMRRGSRVGISSVRAETTWGYTTRDGTARLPGGFWQPHWARLVLGDRVPRGSRLSGINL